MEIRLLGHVVVLVDGQEIPIARSHRRCVLAVLALTPGRPVSSELLIDRVWGEHPPREARHSLHTHISAIRRLIEHNGNGAEHPALRRAGSGYVLEIDQDGIDLHRSRRLAEQARSVGRSDSGDDKRAVELLREACSLWRGTPLASLTADWTSQVRVGLEQERLALFIDRYTVELRLGEHSSVLGPLAELLADHPLVEPLAGLQMLALYRSGRQADALSCYSRTRQRLVDELGDEPGPELRQLHEQVLRRDPALDLGHVDASGESISAVAGPDRVRPAQLPPDMAVFAGRALELQELDTLIPADDGHRSTSVVTSAIDGAAGVGKTTLAVHWAHRVADKFPDGQLYVDLAGYGPDALPKDPLDVVRVFLEALQVSPERIPQTPDAQIGMYRSLLNDLRMLVVLDNARDADHVRPLLPGGAGCLVLVTSRSRLSSLVATEGASTLSLERLTLPEARHLLERRLGVEWIGAEPEATDEIITRCVRLPLALAVVAARARSNPALRAHDLAAQLRDADALDVLSGSDPVTNVRAVMSWSYRALSGEAARLFRLLGLWPGSDFSVPALASLAGVPIREARRLAAELAQAHLINEQTPGRISIHDLLRQYAAEAVRDHDTKAVRDSATRRALDFYVHTAYRAARQLNPQREPIELGSLPPGVFPVDFGDQQAALAWLNLEYPTLRAWLRRAARTRSFTHTWQLAWATPDFLQRQGRWEEWAANQQLALDAAQRLGNPLAEALAHRSLASACGALGRYDDAHRHLTRALERFAKVGHRLEQARTRLNVSVILNYQGRYREALTHTEQALVLFEEDGDVCGQAYAHNGMGWLLLQLAQHDQALNHCSRALTLQQQADDTFGQAATWDTIGYTYHNLGQYRQAVDAYEQSIALVQPHGDRFREAEVTSRLGDTLHDSGEHEAAREQWSNSMKLFDELQRPEASDIRAKLRLCPAYCIPS